MSKCIRCGGSFLTRRRIKLADSEICGKCFGELGFDKSDMLISSLYKYDEIKNGREAYYNNRIDELAAADDIPAVSISFQGYGQERELNQTDEEQEIYNEVRSYISYTQFDLSPLRLVRVSDNYVTIKYGDWDLVRCKFTNRAKWVLFPTVESQKEKHPIEDPGDVLDFGELIINSLERIEKYS